MTTTLETLIAPSIPRIRDKYDEAIEYLNKHPEEIEHAWMECGWKGEPLRDHPAHCLFAVANKTGKLPNFQGNGTCGCLTQIRFSKGHVAETKSLTAAIKADLSIPEVIKDVTIHHLPIFAKWQRRLDRELGRT